MSLPPPTRSGVYWKDYEIATPTFQLTPIEKPDMSPFLIHMTGPNQLVNILKGQGSDPQVPLGHGYLQANVPSHSQKSYDAKVVCFTESPTFALDFFRYRKFDRWRNDMRFGIGFDKSALISDGARPVAYFSDDITAKIISLYHTLKQQGAEILGDTSVSSSVFQLINEIYPLIFPLLETNSAQGFMWEREWRIPYPTGFSFSYSDIRVICCPDNEEPQLRSELGGNESHITFVRTWKEYDDITDYLQRQQSIWRMSSQNSNNQLSRNAKIRQMKTQVQQYNIAINSLDAYKEFMDRIYSELTKLNYEREQLMLKREELQTEIEQLEKDSDLIF
jgi:hypothetical protein